MSRLKISLPEELGHGGDVRTNAERTSRRLGAGIEGADELSRRIVRWRDCWAGHKD